VTDRKLSGYYVEIHPEGTTSEPHEHPGAEAIFVLRGELVVNIEGEDLALQKGDSMYFDSAHPHSYRRNGPSPCAAIVVVTP
jgi:quercetin dioxygenase-like cupin family protein